MRKTAAICASSKGSLIALICIAMAFLLAGISVYPAARGDSVAPKEGQTTSDQADHKSAGCLSCHSPMDEPTMHPTKTVRIGCTDCHGGNAASSVRLGTAQDSPEYLAEKEKAHVQ